MKIIILYGSQTGNAQDIAERIWRQSKNLEIDETVLCSMDQFTMSEELTNPRETRIVFVCSTTGQGEVPDNMSRFWKFIMRRNVPDDFFNFIRFSVIGLGDSSYEKYNFIAKKLHKRLVQLKGQPVLDVCLCDDQDNDGIEGTFAKWTKKFWLNTFDPDLTTTFQKILNIKKDHIVLKYKTTIHTGDFSGRSFDDEDTRTEMASEEKPFYATLTNNQRVTSDEHWQNTRLLEFDVSNIKNLDFIKYEAGDVLMLLPSNFPENIKKFYQTFDHLNLEKLKNKRIDIELNLTEKDLLYTSNLLRRINTVGDLIEKYFDLNSQPRMYFFEIFGKIATDPLEKEKLEEFTRSNDGGEGLEELYNYCYRPRRTICEVLFDFPKTCKNIMSLDVLLEMVPSIKPRAFSIASNLHVHGTKIQTLVAVVEYKTRLFETRKGTCSYWLSSLEPSLNLKIPIWIKKGSFKLDWNKPLICIGPGTGVAPFRSIIYERIEKLNIKENYLYFGCRSKESDFYFEKEWKSFADKNSLELRVAFSQQNNMEKVYVQDLMLIDSEKIFELIDKMEATVLIAGSSKKMPQDVLAILEKIIKNNLFNSSADDIESDKLSNEYIKNLEKMKRIQLETWS